MSAGKPARLGLSRAQMAWRAAQDIADGSYVNLGIGMPETVASYVPEGRTVVYHSENGVLGFAPAAGDDPDDPELVNAGKKPIALVAGASLFHHGDSFAMMRGGHIDMCFLGALQVSHQGDLANWSTGAPDAVPAVGGAMDLVAGVKRVLVLSDHTTRDGAPKLVAACAYPLTGRRVVERVYTNFGVFDTSPDGFVVRELAPGIGRDRVAEATDAPLVFAGEPATIDTPELD